MEEGIDLRLVRLRKESVFDLKGFCPHSMAFLPTLNCLLVAKDTTMKCLDVVSGLCSKSKGKTKPYSLSKVLYTGVAYLNPFLRVKSVYIMSCRPYTYTCTYSCMTSLYFPYLGWCSSGRVCCMCRLTPQ